VLLLLLLVVVRCSFSKARSQQLKLLCSQKVLLVECSSLRFHR
jgi:hypothetical protein